MPVYIWQEDALDKMAQVESEQWKEDQKEFGDCSFQAFFDKWKTEGFSLEKANQMKRKNRGKYLRFEKMFLDVQGTGTIYGEWGWNRYLVNYFGEIIFHEAFSETSYIEKAQKVGFRLFREFLN